MADQYYTLYDSGKFDELSALVEANPVLKDMIINIYNIQYLWDMCIANQRYYLNDIQQYLVQIVKYKGDWNKTIKYTIYNVVNYVVGGAVQNFMGIEEQIPIGTLPTDLTYFISLTLRGEQGASGTGLSPRGTWSSVVNYSQYDCISYNNKLWYAKRANVNKVPQEISDDWEFIQMVTKQVLSSPSKPLNQEVGDCWIEEITNSGVLLDKKARYEIKNSDGTYSTRWFETTGDMVKMADGNTAENKISSLSNPNLFRNPAFQVWQRGENFTFSAGNTYCADMYVFHGVRYGSDFTVSKDLLGMKMVSTKADGVLWLYYRFEETDAVNLRGKVVSLSYSLDGVIHSSVIQSLKLTAPTNQIQIFDLIATTVGETHILNWVKLELGSIATPFVPPFYSEELAYCQRYFRIGRQDSSPLDGRYMRHYIRFPVTMRVAPVITVSSLDYWNTTPPTLWAIQEHTMDGATIVFTPVAIQGADATQSFTWTADASIY